MNLSYPEVRETLLRRVEELVKEYYPNSSLILILSDGKGFTLQASGQVDQFSVATLLYNALRQATFETPYTEEVEP
jgi:hypothetical protein